MRQAAQVALGRALPIILILCTIAKFLAEIAGTGDLYAVAMKHFGRRSHSSEFEDLLSQRDPHLRYSSYSFIQTRGFKDLEVVKGALDGVGEAGRRYGVDERQQQ